MEDNFNASCRTTASIRGLFGVGLDPVANISLDSGAGITAHPMANSPLARCPVRKKRLSSPKSGRALLKLQLRDMKAMANSKKLLLE